MATGIRVVCAHCGVDDRSCPLHDTLAPHCLAAQGWRRSPAKARNWSCPTCAVSYWEPPDPELVQCAHRELLPASDAAAGSAEAATEVTATLPPGAAAAWLADPVAAAIEEIAVEVELTGNRLVAEARRLARRLSHSVAQALEKYFRES